MLSSDAPATAAPSNTCSKCATFRRTGKVSCCAPGGAWFDDCGDADETDFGHTWFEGLQACQSTYSSDRVIGMSFLLSLFMHAVLPEAPSASSTCSKCGTIKKSGKSSCCAPGGAWFKKCGDAGDSDFDYTWMDGIKACQSEPMIASTRRTCQFWRIEALLLIVTINIVSQYSRLRSKKKYVFQVRHHQGKPWTKLLWSRRRLVWELRRSWR